MNGVLLIAFTLISKIQKLLNLKIYLGVLRVSQAKIHFIL